MATWNQHNKYILQKLFLKEIAERCGVTELKTLQAEENTSRVEEYMKEQGDF